MKTSFYDDYPNNLNNEYYALSLKPLDKISLKKIIVIINELVTIRSSDELHIRPSYADNIPIYSYDCALHALLHIKTCSEVKHDFSDLAFYVTNHQVHTSRSIKLSSVNCNKVAKY